MVQVLEISEPTISTNELHSALQPLLRERHNPRCRIARLDREVSAYRSSYPIQELNVILEDGSFLDLIFKNLSEAALLDRARAAKPKIIRNPKREIDVYRKVLPLTKLDTAKFYGAIADDATETYWLFIEDVPGLELYQIGELETWQEVARWLADMHATFADRVSELEREPNLLRRDGEFFWTWMRRAKEFALDSRNASEKIRRLANGFGGVLEQIAQLPRTFIHGEFYASNVLVDDSAKKMRVCPIDWEMAGTGPGLIDLAALVSGGWSEEQRETIASAYYSAMDDRGWRPTFAEFVTALNHCRLMLAVQWLGWARDWSPPPEHRHDWLGEVSYLAESLNV